MNDGFSLDDLDPARRRLLAAWLDRETGPDPAARDALVAYVESGGATLAPGELLGGLRERLPGYMVPVRVVPLDALPRTASGKVDRARLRRERPRPVGVDAGAVGDSPGARSADDPAETALAGAPAAGGLLAPRTDTEATLAAIWADVLGVDEVGVDEDFFELGGDSILSIRIIARANQAGIRIGADQFFDAPTVADLARVASEVDATTPAPADDDGAAPLTPIQHWFLDAVEVDRAHWNQSALVALPDRTSAEDVGVALDALHRHHAALRLSVTEENGAWAQSAAEGRGWPLEVVDLDPAAATDGDAADDPAIATVEARLHASLDLRGPLVRAAFLDGGTGGPRLLLVLHHLVVDGVSWQILLEDLATALEAGSAGRAPSLPATTTSFLAWARHLAAEADRPATRAEARHWLADHPALHHRLPVDHDPGPDGNRRGTAVSRSVHLTGDETRDLLREAPKAYRTGVTDLLLAALLRAVHPWTGRRSLLVDLEGHGRETEGTGLDLSRSVGWFTTVYPVPLALGDGDDPGDDLRTVKETLRAIPRNGIGHGLLRHLSPDRSVRAALAERPGPEVCVNYLGQRETREHGTVGWLRGSGDSARSPRARRRYLLEIDAEVVAGRLEVAITSSPDVHDATTVDALLARLADELRTLLAHCLSGAGGATPSDFPLAGLDQSELDKVAGLLGDDDDDEDGDDAS